MFRKAYKELRWLLPLCAGALLFIQGVPAQETTAGVTGTVTDSTGASARATANLTVTARPKARRLDDLVFGKGSGRVNNCAKRLLLEELTPLSRIRVSRECHILWLPI